MDRINALNQHRTQLHNYNRKVEKRAQVLNAGKTVVGASAIVAGGAGLTKLGNTAPMKDLRAGVKNMGKSIKQSKIIDKSINAVKNSFIVKNKVVSTVTKFAKEHPKAKNLMLITGGLLAVNHAHRAGQIKGEMHTKTAVVDKDIEIAKLQVANEEAKEAIQAHEKKEKASEKLEKETEEAIVASTEAQKTVK